ncbi:MAG: hypothetical protein RL095_3646 [Verrucomicrobiota bacterium]|jgi:hypothetical protein
MKSATFALSLALALCACQEKPAPLPAAPSPVTLAPGNYPATAFDAVSVEQFTRIRQEGALAKRPSFIIRYFGRAEGFDHFLLEGKNGPAPVKLPISQPPPIFFESRPFSPELHQAFIPLTC